MKILITGVNGLLGHEVARLLCANVSNEVYGFARSGAIIDAKNYKHIVGDLGKNDFVRQFPSGLDAVIHFAQSEKFRDFPGSAIEVFDINTVSTLKLLDFSRESGVKKFIYGSSGGVYGNKDIGFTEDSPVMGTGELGFYLSSKLCSEILADNYTTYFNVVQLRFFFVYGERQQKNMLVPRLLQSVLEGKAVTLAGREGIRINPVYVSDAATAVIKTLQLDHSDKINVGGAENLSLKEIVETIALQTGKKAVYEYQQSAPRNLIGDISKMKKVLHQPVISFEAGINKLIKKVRNEQ